MSDKRQLHPPQLLPNTDENVVSSRRPRKPSIRNGNDDKQRERKRALDRKAQRASREKTRSHIAHLEKMVQILSNKNGSPATSELMEEMSRLHAEIDRLRKIIDSIKSVLGADVFEPTFLAVPQRQSTQSLENPPRQSSRSPGTNGSRLFEVNSTSEELPRYQTAEGENPIGSNLDALAMMATKDLDDGQLDNSKTDSNSPMETFDWPNLIDAQSLTQVNSWEGHRNKVFEHTPFWNLPCPLKTVISEPPIADFVPCKIWAKANAIYSLIFDYPKDRMLSASKAEPGSLFKAVKEGWGSLSLQERSNPVLQILKEVDQNLFWDLDPLSKIANLYKSMLLLKYYFNPNTKSLENMPLWQRPVLSQKVHRHPIPIDFFPWPALRDRLVRHHNYYFATNEFSVSYRQHLKFSWPFSFEDAYRYDSVTRAYSISPLFEKYHSDMRCWALEKSFFKKFPELIGEISVYQVDPLEMSGRSPTPRDGNAHAPASTGPGEHTASSTDSFEATDFDFGDECVMELFNECPPT